MSIGGPLEERYKSPSKRRILSMDGGGIRGIITLQILLEIERKLKQALGKDESFRLAHYFDYIGGTSTRAIIAAGLSIGMSVQELIGFYDEMGLAMFDKEFLITRVKALYNNGPIAKALKQTFGEGTNIDLESGRFLTLLCIVTMNRSTDSPWPISNNSLAKYNDKARSDCNLKLSCIS